MNHFKIPLIWPFKMVPSTSTPGIHFDDDWACQQIKSFERIAHYKQKWKKSDTTTLVIESSMAPESLKICNRFGTPLKSISWTNAYTAIGYNIYTLTFSISDLAEGVYYLYQRVAFGSIDWKAVSEPVDSKTSWPLTHLFTYTNSFNDQDVPWTLPLEMKFRCEAGIMDFTPQRDRAAYVNQMRDLTNLSGVPYRAFKLYIGRAPGVAPWVIDLLNRIFCCDSIDIEGKKYQSDDGSKWEVTRVKGYPLIGASIDIVEAVASSSLEFADTTPIAPGILVAYQMEPGFFGPASLIPITDIEQT